MAGMGPPPKPAEQRRRKNKNAPNLTRLPSEGRHGDAPEWPLPDPRGAELKVWRQLWGTPQAVAWEQLGWTRAVARYCRQLVDAEEVDAPVTKLGEVRQMEDRLGLTPMAMLRLRWAIAEDEVSERRDISDGRAVKPRRLVAVDPGAVAGG